MIAVALFDLDGVVRHFDHGFVEDVERRHGIEAGALDRFAFGSPLIDEVTTGRISRRAWIEQIAQRFGNHEAAAEWGRQPFAADAAVLALADELRALGVRTAILTNGTDTIPQELAALGLDAHFEAIFNSATIGFAKPHPRAFQHVLDSMGVVATDVFFTDDSPAKIAGAAALGIATHHYTGAAELRRALHDVGVAVTGHPRPESPGTKR